MKPGHAKQQGVTLVEMVITIVIIGIALAGTIAAFSSVVGRSSDTLIQTRTISLAQAYLDEILALPFDRATPPGGEPPFSGNCRVIGGNANNRPQFRSVDQYDGIVHSPPQLLSGLEGEGYEGFTVSISVSCVGPEIGLPDGHAKRIDVQIGTPLNQTVVFSAYRGHF
ncbi:MAG: type II secretion system GspH family protein [Saccharospirillum sp.]|nr:type II secretion system GspH family protein [Saccharospirillum sp.]